MKHINNRILLAFVILAVGFVIGWLLQEQNLIDACIDAGGRWEKNGSFCQGV